MLTILLTAYIIMIIISLLYIAANMYRKRYTKRCRQYQEHIRGHLPVDRMVDELFPPSTVQVPTVQVPTVHYREAKRKMIADIRKYFEGQKIKLLSSGGEIHDPPDEGTLYLQQQERHTRMQSPIHLLVDTLSGDRYEVHLVRYEQQLAQPALSLWVTAEPHNYASSLYICLARDHSDSRETVSKLTIEGKTVDAEAARRSDEDWMRMIRRTLFLLSAAEHRHRTASLSLISIPLAPSLI